MGQAVAFLECFSNDSKILQGFDQVQLQWREASLRPVESVNNILKTLLEKILDFKIDKFLYIKIQPKTIDLSTRLWGITTEFVKFIPRSLVFRLNFNISQLVYFGRLISGHLFSRFG